MRNASKVCSSSVLLLSVLLLSSHPSLVLRAEAIYSIVEMQGINNETL